MPKLILLIAIGLSVFILWKWFKRLPKGQQKKQALSILLWLSIVAVVLLVVMGRLHWIGAIVAAVAASIKTLLPIIIKVLPFLNGIQKNSPKDQASHLDLDKAYEILGVKPNASKEEIISAHRKLMTKVHPDKGGNDFLAAQLYAAKELAIKALKD